MSVSKADQTISKINEILNDNTYLMNAIHSNISEYLSENTSESRQEVLIQKCRSNQFRIRENYSEINNLMNIPARTTTEEQAYESSVLLKIKYQAEYSSGDVPSVFTKGTAKNFSVSFKNNGIFYSWNASKNVVLKMVILSTENQQVGDVHTYTLDVSENVPGEENVNGDYGKIKSFSVSWDASDVAVDNQYKLKFLISNGSTDFEKASYFNISVV